MDPRWPNYPPSVVFPAAFAFLQRFRAAAAMRARPAALMVRFGFTAASCFCCGARGEAEPFGPADAPPRSRVSSDSSSSIFSRSESACRSWATDKFVIPRESKGGRLRRSTAEGSLRLAGGIAARHPRRAHRRRSLRYLFFNSAESEDPVVISSSAMGRICPPRSGLSSAGLRRA